MNTTPAVANMPVEGVLVEALGISKRFGGHQAVDNVSVSARSGEVTSVIGPNGAGKTTLINCLTGIIPFDTGELRINGQLYRRLAPQDLIEIGISRTFQNIRLWENLSVLEHVLLARRSYLRTARAARRNSSTDAGARDTAHELLQRVELDHKARMMPAQLSYGERRRLEIVRALAISPVLLFLDEPAAGFMLAEQVKLAALIREIAAKQVAIILVEHHMDLIARVSSSVVVLNFGKELTTGSIDQIRQNPDVIAAYLGTAA
ncbi:ABC transporter ATP-binding protein [Paraburkholderia xenovorans]|uniref:ABC transporter ATP-binding protein n=1 Tax=Paraburkholderia xenovorans TaxID=36873 RepID=UPI0015598F48|nr:ABC transporter ATP-binding protein [Paraburkholderia xenovorans]NPT38500.1 ATP-binding cassette domain-containing protein [Paraburkholderia xenovorans]